VEECAIETEGAATDVVEGRLYYSCFELFSSLRQGTAAQEGAVLNGGVVVPT
jgi:hypothetical protein